MIEENGQPVFRVSLYSASSNGSPVWNSADNRRRCELIEKDLDGLLLEAEKLELDTLA